MNTKKSISRKKLQKKKKSTGKEIQKSTSESISYDVIIGNNVDIFDFQKYNKKEYELMGEFLMI
jgi:hypothetical protein